MWFSCNWRWILWLVLFKMTWKRNQKFVQRQEFDTFPLQSIHPMGFHLQLQLEIFPDARLFLKAIENFISDSKFIIRFDKKIKIILFLAIKGLLFDRFMRFYGIKYVIVISNNSCFEVEKKLGIRIGGVSVSNRVTIEHSSVMIVTRNYSFQEGFGLVNDTLKITCHQNPGYFLNSNRDFYSHVEP